ncbi:MAG: hypothetical protein AMJ42_00415 [Deltaproteobacteria bacterium DG_8]|nr:MAG: hypothetical protein AMJ42_00415 [Deltaproteobacteria bacterium DG_8]
MRKLLFVYTDLQSIAHTSRMVIPPWQSNVINFCDLSILCGEIKFFDYHIKGGHSYGKAQS